jgi:hypothetical protein
VSKDKVGRFGLLVAGEAAFHKRRVTRLAVCKADVDAFSITRAWAELTRNNDTREFPGMTVPGVSGTPSIWISICRRPRVPHTPDFL